MAKRGRKSSRCYKCRPRKCVKKGRKRKSKKYH